MSMKILERPGFILTQVYLGESLGKGYQITENRQDRYVHITDAEMSEICAMVKYNTEIYDLTRIVEECKDILWFLRGFLTREAQDSSAPPCGLDTRHIQALSKLIKSTQNYQS